MCILVRKDATLTGQQQQTDQSQTKKEVSNSLPSILFGGRSSPLRTVVISSRICSDTFKTTHKE